MRKRNFILGCSVVGVALLSGVSACTSSSGHTGTNGAGGADSTATGGAGGSHSGTGGSHTGGALRNDAGCVVGAPNSTYVLIDDMETTTHGPLEFDAGIVRPQLSGFWYNSGANYTGDAGGVDSSDPPQLSFRFSALSSPTSTFNCIASKHAARQSCMLNGLYDTCGVGFEFAQVPDGDAGAASVNDAGDLPRITVPFDISSYKAITFWGMTTTPDTPATTPSTTPDAATTPITMQVKVSFPDTDTDPRGQICNGGGLNTSMCYNSYAAYLDFTTSWQQFTVLLNAGKTAGETPDGGIGIDAKWGYQDAKWIPTQVYGINWQAQRNIEPNKAPPMHTEIWVDDVYFVK